MATDQASTSTLPLETRFSRTAPGQLWQVPVFLLGLAAVAGVWASRPYWHDAEARQLDRDLEEVRWALDERHPDLEAILGRAERALEHIDRAPTRTGEAHFLLGSCFAQRAAGGAGEQSIHAWQQARLHLEEAERTGVPTSDLAKLSFRLGTAYAHLNVNTEKAIAYLRRSDEGGPDEAAERYALLAETYLKLPTPDLQAALDYTQKQLALPADDDATLAPARLRCGELLLRLQRRDEAHQVLGRIKPGAPPSIVFRAQYLQAKSYQEEGNWKEAARIWEEVKQAPEAAGERGRILYQLGLCYRKDGRLTEAVHIWDSEEVDTLDPETKQAAALGIADVLVRNNDAGGNALRILEGALHNVESPADYRNSLVSLSEARSMLEAACKTQRDAGDPEYFEQFAKLYTRIAEPPAGHKFLGEAAEATGRGFFERARKLGASEETRRLEESAREHFQRAGAAYEAVAHASRGQRDEPDWLRRSADCYFRAGEHQRLLDVVQQFVRPLQQKRELSEEEKKKLGEAWFMSGEAHRALKHGQAALAAYQLCIAYTSPFAYPARYQLALAEIDRGRLEAAEEALEQLLKLLGPAADNETYEKTLFTLGELHYRRGNWTAAERRLQEALERYPANPSATQARSRLAKSCWALAKDASEHGVGAQSTPQTRSHYLALRRKWLEVAAVNFQKLADDLAARQVKTPLSKDEESMLRDAAFGAADCRFDLLQFEEAIRLYYALSERYRLRVEGLVALRNLWRCFWVKAPTADQDRSTYEAAAQAAYAKIAAALKEMPNSAFDNSAADRTRQYWEDWLANRK